jgi:hypothetical protein
MGLNAGYLLKSFLLDIKRKTPKKSDIIYVCKLFTATMKEISPDENTDASKIRMLLQNLFGLIVRAKNCTTTVSFASFCMEEIRMFWRQQKRKGVAKIRRQHKPNTCSSQCAMVNITVF